MHYRADVVLTASKAAFGGRRRLLADILSVMPPRVRSAATALLQPGVAVVEDVNVLPAAPLPPPASTCSTNAKPGQQCPAGWDSVNKLVEPSPAATQVAVATASSAGSDNGPRHSSRTHRKKPSRIAGTVSSLHTAPTATAGAVSDSSVGAASTSASANNTSAYCAGSALVRPVGIDYSILKPFNLEADEVGDWSYHAGIDFAVPVGVDVRVAHDGVIASAGTDPSLGAYVVGLLCVHT